VLLASLGLHIAGYVPGAPLAFDQVKWLTLAAFACFLLMAAHYAALNRAIHRQVRGDEAAWAWFNAQIPRRVRRVFSLFFVYVIASAAVHFATYEGQPRVKDGALALVNHGKIARVVSEPEFRDAQRLEVRGMSGHWMGFSALAAAYFLVVYPRARGALTAPREPEPAPLPPTVLEPRGAAR
jgi:hypothetical protein